jgi:hypothetical protein
MSWELDLLADVYSIVKPVRGKHWGVYAYGTSLDSYRYCHACKSWRRFPGATPLIHNGGKPRR